jgi:hypothetical protein
MDRIQLPYRNDTGTIELPYTEKQGWSCKNIQVWACGYAIKKQEEVPFSYPAGDALRQDKVRSTDVVETRGCKLTTVFTE